MSHYLVASLIAVTMTLATAWTIYTNVVTVSSHLHSLLPPWDGDAIAAFPTFQKWYRLFIYFLGYVAASYRSSVHPSISTQNGTVLSPAAVKSQNGHGG